MSSEKTHKCGWAIGPADKYCRGCGERVFKASREYGDITSQMESLKNMAMDKPHPAFSAVVMMIYNILAWASGDSQTSPSELVKQMEKMADKFPGGFGGWGPPPSGPNA